MGLLSDRTLQLSQWHIVLGHSCFFISRYEQAPGSELHPRDEREKIDCVFWDLLGAIKR